MRALDDISTVVHNDPKIPNVSIVPVALTVFFSLKSLAIPHVSE
jgi:hypothetical protein